MNDVRSKKMITVLIPCYNESSNIEAMYKAITEQMEKLDSKYCYEILFRDNASTDNSEEIFRRIAKDDPKHVRVILNAKNYQSDGYKDTISGRFQGDVVISIPCDFQEPPELIPEFIYWYEQGYEVVAGQKTASEEGKIKYALRQLFYWIIQKMSETTQYANMSGILLLSRRVMELKKNSDVDQPIRYFISETGVPVKLIQYKQKKRRSGKSSFNISRYFNWAVKALIFTSVKPLHIVTVSGFFMSILSFLIGLTYLILKFVFWDRFIMGTAPVLIGIFFIGSVILFYIGVVGEYVGAIVKKVTVHAPGLVNDLINYEDSDKDPLLFKKPKDPQGNQSNYLS